LTNIHLGYFGIDYTTLEFSTTDYVVRSADALFVPATVILSIFILALVAHLTMKKGLSSQLFRKVLRVAAIATTVIGVVIGCAGFVLMFKKLPEILDAYYLLPPVLLGGGVALAAYSVFVLGFSTRDGRRT
jgi:hypothetical protein